MKIFEDLTRPRLEFFNMMKRDSRLEKVWTREGTIFFTWKNDLKVCRIQGLYDGGILLNYSFHDVMACFKRYTFRGGEAGEET